MTLPMNDKIANLIGKLNFYKLIPYPVPPNNRKSCSVLSTGRASLVLCIRYMAHSTSFLFKQSDVRHLFHCLSIFRPLVSWYFMTWKQIWKHLTYQFFRLFHKLIFIQIFPFVIHWCGLDLEKACQCQNINDFVCNYSTWEDRSPVF